MSDDHSKLVPLLPIPNRTVKRLSADDSAGSRVKVGHRQALTMRCAQLIFDWLGVFSSVLSQAKTARSHARFVNRPIFELTPRSWTVAIPPIRRSKLVFLFVPVRRK